MSRHDTLEYDECPISQTKTKCSEATVNYCNASQITNITQTVSLKTGHDIPLKASAFTTNCL